MLALLMLSLVLLLPPEQFSLNCKVGPVTECGLGGVGVGVTGLFRTPPHTFRPKTMKKCCQPKQQIFLYTSFIKTMPFLDLMTAFDMVDNCFEQSSVTNIMHL